MKTPDTLAERAPARPDTRRRRPPRRDKLAPYLFVAPFLALFLVFGAYPLIKSVILSFYITSGPRDQVFVGLENFRFLLSDPDFWKAVRNTAVYTVWSLALQIPLGLGLAILLNSRWVKGREFFRLAFFSPNLVGQVFVGVLFSVLFVPQYGLVNRFLHATVGAPLDTRWLSEPSRLCPR
jgi:ABC-type sugar transport system permease subunit